MIPILKVPMTLDIYKDRKVVLWGCGFYGKKLLLRLKYLGITISYCCDRNEALWGTTFCGVPVISPKALGELAQKEELVVQIGTQALEGEVQSQLEEMGISQIVSFQAWHMLSFLQIKEAIHQNPHLLEEEKQSYVEQRPLVSQANVRHFTLFEPEYVYICPPPKTGDHTMLNTCTAHGIPASLMTHTPAYMDKALMQSVNHPIRIVTAVREPISRDLSALYQGISCYEIFVPHLDEPLDGKDFWAGHLDAQVLWERFLEDGGGYKINFRHWRKERNEKAYFHAFYEDFKESMVDVLDYPFDKEKGYTVIEEGNLQIFVYQLEKLNGLLPELGAFLGVPLEKLESGNIASEKWISDSYQVAKKELKISQEYFDTVYADPYLQHFYKAEDIQKFQDKWKKNIK